MGGKDVTRISWLMDELERLEERFADEPAAIEALEAVKFWAIEESVLDAADPAGQRDAGT